MPNADVDFPDCGLLAILAHPDDESLACGGLLARCADLGVSVSLLCITRGGHSLEAPQATSRHLRDARSLELEAAARTLGIHDVVLFDYPDGFLPACDTPTLQEDIGHIIRRIRPDVVVTFGPDGLYWHPDHLVVHATTTAAVKAMGDEAPALYYVTMPRGMMRAAVEAVAARVDSVSDRSAIFGVRDLDAFGVLAQAPTLVVDVAEYAVTKLSAMKCHHTQLLTGPFGLMSDADARQFFGVEHFHRAAVGATGPAFVDRLGVVATAPLAMR